MAGAERLLYAGLLVLALAGTALPLELVLHVRVLRRWRRLLATLAPVFVLFTAWDAYAVSRGQWHYDPRQTLGWRIGNLPVEELAFFVVVPVCAVLAVEAVVAVRGWRLDRR